MTFRTPQSHRHGAVALATALLFFLATTRVFAEALIVGVQLEPPGLDPTSGAAAATDEIVYANVFEGLTRIREDGAVAPALAKRWTRSDDGLVYDFYLRSDVAFHDGAPFTADDVVFSLTRAGAAGSTNAQRAIFERIDQVVAVSPLHARVILKEPVGALPTYLGWGDAAMVSRRTAAMNPAAPVGTGPFRFLRWRRGASIVLVRNEDYWGDAPALDEISFRFIADPTAAFAALMAGDVDGFPNYPAPEALPVIARDARFRIVEGASEGEIILALNNARAPLDDIRVRRALAHAVDRKAVIDGALFGRGEAIGSHVPPHHPAYVDLTGRYPHDPARARDLLAEAGLADGFQATLALPPPAYARRAGEIIAAELAAIGIDVRIRNIEWATWLSSVFSEADYDLTIVAHTEPADIDIYARDGYYFQYRDENFNALIEELFSAGDDAARTRLLRAAQEKLSEDAVNVFLAAATKTGVWRKSVSGVWANAPLQANDFTQAANPDRDAVYARAQARAALPVLPALAAALLATAIALARLGGVDAAYVARRAASLGLALLVALLIVFFFLELAPGDAASMIMGVNADPAALEALRAELGVDRPALVRYFEWIGGLAMGDFGVSYAYRTPIADLIAERVVVSAPLALFAFALTVVVGAPMGIIAAAYRRRFVGKALAGAAQVGVAAPNFWLAILMVAVFAIGLRWFSAGGFPGWDVSVRGSVKALVLPAIAMAIPQAAILAQVTRAAMIDVLRSDYIRTARAKGLSWGETVRRHAVRNAMVPVLTILGLQFSFLVAGGVIVENVFYLPGLGRFIVQSVAARDLASVRSIVFLLIVFVIVVALLIDLAYAVADPRLRRARAV